MGLFDDITSLFDPSAGGGGAGDFTSALPALLDTGLGLGNGAVPVNTYPSYNLPEFSVPQFATQPMAMPVAASAGGLMTAAGSAVARAAAPILFKMAQALGLKSIPSLANAYRRVIKAMKLLGNPAVVATAFGLNLAELASLITLAQKRKRRRMNVANTKALRRSVRRLEGFNKLSHRVYANLSHIRGGGRRSVRRVGAACVTCRKNPCRC